MSSKKHSRIARVLCDSIPLRSHPSRVPEEEANHLHQVLRLKNGDSVIALDGKGAEITGELCYREKSLWIETSLEKPTRSTKPETETSPLVLEMAIIKGDAMSWVIEKAVELGVRRLVPVECDHGVVEIGKKGAQHFVERWQRIADQALKQCERLHRMTIEAPVSSREILGRKAPLRWVAIEPSAEFQALPPLAFSSTLETHVLIGPEGGWSAQECEAFRAEIRLGTLKPASLGPLVLRAETAALFAMSVARCFYSSFR
jgi:16S rRNA (uracil1498-N3)-methyltransferase